MKNAILVRGARQLLTLRGPGGPRRGTALNQLGIIEDGSLLIADGLIQDVGSTRRVENLAAARHASEIPAEGRVVMPGFVDSHTHLISGQPRLDDFEMESAHGPGGAVLDARMILPNVADVRRTSARKLESGAARILHGFLRHGTTTVEAKSGYGLNRTGELKILRVLAALQRQPIELVPTFLGAMIPGPEFTDRPDEYINWLCSDLLPVVRRRKLARFVDVCCDRGAFTTAQARRCLQAAAALGFKLKVHTGQSANVGGVALAVEFGATSVDHLAHSSEADAVLLGGCGTIATLLPGAVFHLGGEQYPPARLLMERGAAVALASNYSRVTTPSYNMQMILSLACRKMQMTPSEAISAATINAAHAVADGQRTGSLEVGKAADLIVLDVPDYREVAYDFGANMVSLTMSKGKVVYDSSLPDTQPADSPGPPRHPVRERISLPRRA